MCVCVRVERSVLNIFIINNIEHGVEVIAAMTRQIPVLFSFVRSFSYPIFGTLPNPDGIHF